MAEETFFFKLAPLNIALEGVFKKGQEFATFLFPMPEFIMTDKAKESSDRHESVLGYNVYETALKDVENLRQKTLSDYAGIFKPTGEQLTIFIIALAVLLVLILGVIK